MDKVEVLFDSLSYYKVLGVNSNASEEEIRIKFKELVKLWHPDHNDKPEALDMFQKISQAYDVLKNPDMRLKYDMLSLVYGKDNFPDMNALILLRNLHGQEDLNLRAFRLIEVTGKGLGHSAVERVYYCSQYEAGGVVAQITKHNWVFGFLGLSSIFVNLRAIFKNISMINNRKDNLLLAVHNALVCDANGRKEEALTLLYIAKEYAKGKEVDYLNMYIKRFEGVRPFAVKGWNFGKLKRMQLFYPLILIVAICCVIGGVYLKKFEKQRQSGANVKEEVVFRDGSRAFSDVAVAKIFDIPVDVYDKERLYHLIEDSDAMHGADDSFDLYKRIESGTTVRITGQTVDNKWLRVMFDNGEMAFIKASKLKKGIGKEIPLWSKIYKEN